MSICLIHLFFVALVSNSPISMSSTKRSRTNSSGSAQRMSKRSRLQSPERQTARDQDVQTARVQDVPELLEEIRDKEYLGLWQKHGPMLIQACEAKTEDSANEAKAIIAALRNGINRVDQRLGMIKDANSSVSYEVVTFGSNEDDQLGRGAAALESGDWEEAEAPALIQGCRLRICRGRALQDITPRQVDAGGMSLAIVSHDGYLYTAGTPDQGCIGRTVNKEDDEVAVVEAAKPTRVTGFFSPKSDVFCPNNCVMQVAAGNAHMAILTLKGDIFMFGCYIDDGRRFSDIRAPNNDDAPKWTKDGSEKKKNNSPLGFNVKPVHVFQLAQKATAIAAGASFNAAILDDGSLVTWGKFLLLFWFLSSCALAYSLYLLWISPKEWVFSVSLGAAPT
jgi:alpha-tubulin suppressor-like RCC1 family protein